MPEIIDTTPKRQTADVATGVAQGQQGVTQALINLTKALNTGLSVVGQSLPQAGAGADPVAAAGSGIATGIRQAGQNIRERATQDRQIQAQKDLQRQADDAAMDRTVADNRAARKTAKISSRGAQQVAQINQRTSIKTQKMADRAAAERDQERAKTEFYKDLTQTIQIETAQTKIDNQAMFDATMSLVTPALAAAEAVTEDTEFGRRVRGYGDSLRQNAMEIISGLDRRAAFGTLSKLVANVFAARAAELGIPFNIQTDGLPDETPEWVGQAGAPMRNRPRNKHGKPVPDSSVVDIGAAVVGMHEMILHALGMANKIDSINARGEFSKQADIQLDAARINTVRNAEQLRVTRRIADKMTELERSIGVVDDLTNQYLGEQREDALSFGSAFMSQAISGPRGREESSNRIASRTLVRSLEESVPGAWTFVQSVTKDLSNPNRKAMFDPRVAAAVNILTELKSQVQLASSHYGDKAATPVSGEAAGKALEESGPRLGLTGKELIASLKTSNPNLLRRIEAGELTLDDVIYGADTREYIGQAVGILDSMISGLKSTPEYQAHVSIKTIVDDATIAQAADRAAGNGTAIFDEYARLYREQIEAAGSITDDDPVPAPIEYLRVMGELVEWNKQPTRAVRPVSRSQMPGPQMSNMPRPMPGTQGSLGDNF